MLSKFSKSDFVKSLSILVSGTIVSQLLNYIFLPILSRIYSVEEMADLSLFLRVSGFIIGIGTARFEYTLPLPKQESHSFLLYRISVRIATVVSIVASIVGVIWLFIQPFNWFNVWFVILVLVGSFFSIMINLGTNWSIRNNTFQFISRSRILNSLLSNVFKLGFAYLKMGSLGLLLGTVLAYIFASIRFVKEYLTRKTVYLPHFSKAKQLVLVKEYKHFPLINLPHSLSDLGRDLLIAFFVVMYFGKEIFGLYSYSLMVLNVPITLIGVSISQVFFNKVSKMVHNGEPIYTFVKRMMFILFGIAIVPFTILYFFAPTIFTVFLGDAWTIAGTYSQIMVLYFLFNFLVSPLSQLSFVINRQKEMFIIGLCHSVGQVILFGTLPMFFGCSEEGFRLTLRVLVCFQSLMMIVNIAFYLRFSKNYSVELASS